METFGTERLCEKAFRPWSCSAKKLFHLAKKLFGESEKTLVFFTFPKHDFAQRTLVGAPPLSSDLVASSPKVLCKKLFRRTFVFEKAFCPTPPYRKSFLHVGKAFPKLFHFEKAV